jgi:hypothetical protein
VFGWTHLEAIGKASPRVLHAGLAASLAVSLALLLPLRLVQVADFVRPYASARAAIERTPADLVLVDPGGLFYADDLVRNRPFLDQRPIAVDLAYLKPAQLDGLCAGRTVALFGVAEGARYGIRRTGRWATPALDELRRRLRTGTCANRLNMAP